MARTLPPGLATKISAAGQQPELSVTVQDLVTKLTTVATAPWPHGYSAALLSSSGKILRAVVQDPATGPLYVKAITPTTPADWTSPGVLLSAAAIGPAGAALAQSGPLTRCFYQRSSDLHIVYQDSTDDGATWGGEVDVLAAPQPFCTGIAATDPDSLWATFYTFPEAANILYRSANTGGTWSTWSNEGPASPPWVQMRGLAAITAAGVAYFACGAALRGYSSGISAAAFSYDAGTYSPMTAIQQLDSPAAGLSCSYPDLFSDGTTFYAVVTLTDDGSVSTAAHTRTTLYSSPDAVTWHPLLAAGSSLQYGAHCIITGGVTYLFDAVTCYTVPPPAPPIDLTDDLLSLQVHERFNTPATLELTLSNDRGQYTAAPWLSDNATISIALGYGAQTVPTHTAYLDDWQLESSATGQTLTLAARDSLKLLDYPSTRLLSYTNQTVTAILSDLAKQSGVPINPPPSTPQFSQIIGCFLINPGETWLSALNRLASVFGFLYASDGGASVSLTDPQLSDPTTWEYGAEILAASRGQEADAANVIRVIGASSSTDPVWAEVTDAADILLRGAERYRIVVDRILTTSAQCLLRAQQELRAEGRTKVHAALTVALNPQHQLGDVVTVTDSGCGLSSTALRISGMQWIAEPASQAWEHHLTLEAP
jgi:prophage tail gpP-like protein